MFRSLLARLLPFALVALPFIASAQAETVSRVVGIFNIFVGLMLTASILVFGLGFIMWWVRLGTWPTYRTEAVKIMEWGVALLFVLDVLLAIVQFFQRHPRAATYVISLIVVIAIIWMLVYVAVHSGGGEEHATER